LLHLNLLIIFRVFQLRILFTEVLIASQITKALKDYIFGIKLRQIEKLKLFGVDKQTIENMNKVLVILSLASLAVQVIYLCFYVLLGNFIL